MIRFLKQASVISFCLLFLLAICGFNVVKHHCDACHTTTFSLIKGEHTCHHQKAEPQVSHFKKDACCEKEAEKEPEERQIEGCHACSNTLLYVKLNEKFLNESVVVQNQGVDFVSALASETVIQPIQFHTEVLNLNYCGPPFIPHGKDLLISFHSLKLDC